MQYPNFNMFSLSLSLLISCMPGVKINSGRLARSHCSRLIESTTILYRDREIHPSVKDLQSTMRLAKSWTMHIFDTREDFPVPVQSGG